ncbi:3-hydroxyacyl-CoA dehydrogenase NAD-binding domain-containing protein [Svornostia abyssi]|uniref:3-hydroxyacyl-CoA dehydrogenase NAD-binding domain-containing protein n=1 Tax=Svornostia abyssi TaxID=2898438 RepID=A0ABY5PIS9_9ACTN|nr:3-hydroxyacyl-CoA dehydrogenase NAD-binding domain-containing protein [Parviterribacteraceae bacterium J379]
MSERNTIRWEDLGDGVVGLIFDDPEQSANTMNRAFFDSYLATVDRVEAEKDSIMGIVVTSGKKTFFAGADLNDMLEATKETAAEAFADATNLKRAARRLETLGIPTVAAINGAALGGGLELCLSCHHRIAVDDPKIKVGLPEVKLGLLPGGGGVVRTVRMLGLVPALMQVLLQGTEFRPDKAVEVGLVDELVPTADDLVPAAKKWIAEHPGAQQPWDADPNYKIPGGTPADMELAMNLPAFPANLRKQLRGANYLAPRNILAAAVESTQLEFDAALEVETRYLLDCATSQVAKNMINAFFFNLQTVTKRDRPEGHETFEPKKMVMLGAGMMGAAIAYVSARAGIEVVLKDVTLEAAEKGKEYSETLVRKAVDRGRMTEEKGQALLDRIIPTADPADAAGAELLVEAVFEDVALKAKVYAEIEPYLAEDALLCSNTSGLPITELAEGVTRPADFIGTHFFSPVDKMPLLEIVKGDKTSDETVARTLDYTAVIKKVPIVINDSPGFFTSRVISRFTGEALGMVTEGIPGATIEQASGQAGYPAPVLQLADEINIETILRAFRANPAATEGLEAALLVLEKMMEAGRPGKLRGAGFYDYEDGKRAGIWKGLAEMFPPVADPSQLDVIELGERMMVRQALETVKCFDEGVLETVAEANIGSIMGIGFPAWTGGVVQYMNQYEGGLAGFVERAREFEAKYGEHFAVPASLVEKAERGEIYSDEAVATPA